MWDANGHARGIMADSLVARSPEATNAVYRRVVADPVLQRSFIALTGRTILPAAFQRAFLGSLSRRKAAA